MRNSIQNERGIAIAICLFALAILSSITVAAMSSSRSNMLTSRNYRSASQGLSAAEAGIAHAVQIINTVGVINLTSDVVNVWPGGLAPFGSNPQTMQQKTTYNYNVAIATLPVGYPNASVNRAVMTATGSGSDNSVRMVKAYVIKSDIPNAPPGAIYLATNNP